MNHALSDNDRISRGRAARLLLSDEMVLSLFAEADRKQWAAALAARTDAERADAIALARAYRAVLHDLKAIGQQGEILEGNQANGG